MDEKKNFPLIGISLVILGAIFAAALHKEYSLGPLGFAFIVVGILFLITGMKK